MAVTVTAKSRTITNGTANDGSVVEAIQTELYDNDQTLATAVTSLQDNNMTIGGIKTFTSAPLVNQIDERTSGSGVTIDGAKIKDGAINVVGTSQPYAPSANGDIGYDSTNHTYDVQVNGVARSLYHTGNLPTASDTVVGAIEIATNAEVQTGTASTLAVVPSAQKYHPSAVKAWCQITYSGGTPSITSGDYGFASVSDDGTGTIGTTFDTAMANTNYAILFGYSRADSVTAGLSPNYNGKSTSGVTVSTWTTSALVDANAVSVAILGALP